MKPSVRGILGTVVAVLAWGLMTTTAGAATITPTVLSDDITENGNCTLREAIQATNLNSDVDLCDHNGVNEPDAISLAAGTYELSLDGAGNDSNSQGDLDVDLTLGAGLTIDGAGAGSTTIDTEAGWADRVIHIVGGGSPLTVRELTLTGGDVSGFPGGGGIAAGTGASLAVTGARVTGNEDDFQGAGISAVASSSLAITDSVIAANATTGPSGGGVHSGAATTTIDSSVIRGNTVTNGGAPEGAGLKTVSSALTLTDSVVADNHLIGTGGSVPFGGGLRVIDGSALIERTTISDNDVSGGGARRGGGLALSANATLVNSTVSGNEALGTNGSGGGLFSEFGTTTNIIHTTFGPNPVGVTGSAIFNNGLVGGVTLRGSLVETSGAAPACNTAITSGDDNVIADSSCVPELGNDVVLDPLLGALLDNGGLDAGAPGLLEPLLTHLPAAASVAVDHVPAADCLDELSAPLLVDQRGFTRPLDGDDDGTAADCDAGSVERPATPPVVVDDPPDEDKTAPPQDTSKKKKKKCKRGKKKGKSKKRAKKCKKR